MKEIFGTAQRRFMEVLLILLLFRGWVTIFEVTEKARLSVREHEKIISFARESGCRKCIVDIEEFNLHAFLHHEAFYNTLVLSSIAGPAESVQIIYSEKERVPEIEALSPERIMLMDYRFINNKEELNHNYFDLPVERYRFINYKGSDDPPR